MDKILAYAISAFIVSFADCTFPPHLRSAAPPLSPFFALIPIVIELLSAFGPS